MTPRSWAFAIVGGFIALLVMSGCAGLDGYACEHGRTLRRIDGQLQCVGFGRGFDYQAIPPRAHALWVRD